MALDLEWALHCLHCDGRSHVTRLDGFSLPPGFPKYGVEDVLREQLGICRQKAVTFESLCQPGNGIAELATGLDSQTVADIMAMKCTNGNDVSLVLSLMAEQLRRKVVAFYRDKVML